MAHKHSEVGQGVVEFVALVLVLLFLGCLVAFVGQSIVDSIRRANLGVAASDAQRAMPKMSVTVEGSNFGWTSWGHCGEDTTTVSARVTNNDTKPREVYMEADMWPVFPPGRTELDGYDAWIGTWSKSVIGPGSTLDITIPMGNFSPDYAWDCPGSGQPYQLCIWLDMVARSGDDMSLVNGDKPAWVLYPERGCPTWTNH